MRRSKYHNRDRNSVTCVVHEDEDVHVHVHVGTSKRRELASITLDHSFTTRISQYHTSYTVRTRPASTYSQDIHGRELTKGLPYFQ
jgi:hypothetical protein